MYLPKSSPFFICLVFLLFITLSYASATKHKNATKPQLLHAVTGNVSTITGTGSESPQEVTFHCYSKRDCAFAGPNATCFNYQCICDLGYLSVNAYCRKLNCTADIDCRRRFYNTRCNRFQKACVCDYGTHLDRYSQTCLFNGDDYLALKISLPISIFFVALLTACVCCCCCKRRRRNRDQQARLLANQVDPNGAMYQAVSSPGGGYQERYQSANVFYPSLNQAPPPYNPAYTSSNDNWTAKS